MQRTNTKVRWSTPYVMCACACSCSNLLLFECSLFLSSRARHVVITFSLAVLSPTVARDVLQSAYLCCAL